MRDAETLTKKSLAWRRVAPFFLFRGAALRCYGTPAELRRSGSQAGSAGICLGRLSGPFSSCRSPQSALKCSYRSDSVTRDEPLALRVFYA